MTLEVNFGSSIYCVIRIELISLTPVFLFVKWGWVLHSYGCCRGEEEGLGSW